MVRKLNYFIEQLANVNNIAYTLVTSPIYTIKEVNDKILISLTCKTVLIG